jgi:4-amino-4-deoxy-L-arabinose transferase-like glycosyltransferase
MGNDSLAGSPRSFTRGRLVLLAIVLVALGIRCWSVYAQGTAFDRDATLFFGQAQDLARGNVYSWFTAHRKPPVYSGLLALGMVMGLSPVAAGRAVSVLAGVLVLHPAWLILRRCGPRSTALLALALVALLKEPIQVSSRCISDSTYAVIALYALYFLLARGLIDGRLPGFACAGALVGLAYLARTEGIALLVPGAVLILAGMIGGRLRPRVALLGGGLLLLVALAVVSSHVVAVSLKEGQFTVRRNVGQFILYSLGVAASKVPLEGQGASPTGELVWNVGGMAWSWTRHLLDYLSDKLPRAGGYASAVFLGAGLAADRRQLWRWGVWQLGLAVALLTLLILSLVEPHTRYLMGLIALTGWTMARGSEGIVDAVRRVSPWARRSPDWLRVAAAWAAVAIVGGISVASVAREDRYREREFLGGAELIRAHAPPGRTPRVATTESPVAYHARGDAIELNTKWVLTEEELGDLLTREKADFLVIRPDELKAMCSPIDPARPPAFLRLIGKIPSDVRSRKTRSILVCQVASEGL